MSTPPSSPVTAAPLDELLRRVAEAVRDSCRENWNVSRWLGDDFDLDAIIARVKREGVSAEDDAEIDPDAPLEGTNRDLIELVDLSYRQGVERGRGSPTVADVVKLLDESIVSMEERRGGFAGFDAKWADGALFAFKNVRIQIEERIRWAREQPAESAPAAVQQNCPKRFDGTHCEHWWDGDRPCCDCGAGESGLPAEQPAESVPTSGVKLTSIAGKELTVAQMEELDATIDRVYASAIAAAEARGHARAGAESAPTSVCAYEEFGWCASHQYAMKACPHGIAADRAEVRLAGLREAEEALRRDKTIIYHDAALDEARYQGRLDCRREIRALIEKP